MANASETPSNLQTHMLHCAPVIRFKEEVLRIVRLLFGAPFETPTRDEQAMFQASGARMRSSAGGRQVGAVAIDDCGELLASGTNDVPKAGGGQYWAGDEPDHRDFQSGVDFNDQEKLLVVADLLDRLKECFGVVKPRDESDSQVERSRRKGPCKGRSVSQESCLGST